MEKWTLITGASSGIGRETALKLASENHNLVICGRRQERLEQLRDIISKKTKVKVLILSFDIQNLSTIEEKMKEFSSELANVTTLINNAGLAIGVDTLDKGNPHDWDQVIDTNIKGLLYMTRLMLPILKTHKHADIINLGSVAGRWTYPGGAVYCATKHAVRAISEGLRQDLFGSNIRVCCIEPGLVETEFSLVRLKDEEKARAVYAGIETLTPSDIADTVSWILNRPKHMTIQEIVIYPTAQASVTLVDRK